MNCAKGIALLTWLNHVCQGPKPLESLDEVIQNDQVDTFRRILKQLVGIEGLEAPICILKKWLQSERKVFVFDEHDPLAVATAILGAAVNSKMLDNNVREIMKLDGEHQAELMKLIGEFNDTIKIPEAAQLRALLNRKYETKKIHRSTSIEEENCVPNVEALATKGKLAAANSRIMDLERTCEFLEGQVIELQEKLQKQTQKSTLSVSALKERLKNLEETIQAQTDELDIARGKALQLTKCEAKNTKLMRKLALANELRNKLLELQENQLSPKGDDGEQELRLVSRLKQQLDNWRTKSDEAQKQALQASNELRRIKEAYSEASAQLVYFSDRERLLNDQIDAQKDSIAELEAKLELSVQSTGEVRKASMAFSENGGDTNDINEYFKTDRAIDSANMDPDSNAANNTQNKNVVLLEPEVKSEKEKMKQMEFSRSAEIFSEKKPKDSLDSEKKKLESVVKQLLITNRDLELENDLYKNNNLELRQLNEEQEVNNRREKQLLSSAIHNIGIEIQLRMLQSKAPSEGWLSQSRNRV